MIQPQSLSHVDVAHSLALFRHKSPLIHCMTNDVVQTFTANVLLALGCQAVLMNGGHLSEKESPDWLLTCELEQRFTAPRIITRNTHGTGCTLSAALAALRPRHDNWVATVQAAKQWLQGALEQADSLEVGHGHGPVHHFHQWW